MKLKDNKMGAYYNYDASGERNLKLTGGTVDVAGEPIFFYHSDHLGSASYITDSAGNETQQLVYLPFGEDWVDWKYNTSQFETSYKFNGKEKDTETGYNNYGARFYYDYLSIFLSTDPMSDKYPNLSSYAYCANNPVMLIDPNGMEIGDYYDKNGNWLSNDGIDDNKVYQTNENGNISYGIGILNDTKFNYIGTVDNVKMTFNGSANENNPKRADGQLNLIQTVGNKEFTRASYDAIGGPWGNGSSENGSYSVDNLRNRNTDGMLKEGVGFSLDVNPLFETGRSLLRIHPDGGKYEGTQGCIGLTGGKNQLSEFRNMIKSVLSKQNNIPLKINILNNPNNNGYGKKNQSNGE